MTCYTESEAPYYYFKKMDYVKNTDSVMIVDIGGGSTDYVYFNENKPVAASSVHLVVIYYGVMVIRNLIISEQMVSIRNTLAP